MMYCKNCNEPISMDRSAPWVVPLWYHPGRVDIDNHGYTCNNDDDAVAEPHQSLFTKKDNQ